MGWAGPSSFFFLFFFVKKTFQKYGLGFLQFPRALVMLFLIKINCIFTSLKIPSFCQKKEKNIFVHTAKSLKKKKLHHIFIQQRKLQKKN